MVVIKKYLVNKMDTLLFKIMRRISYLSKLEIDKKKKLIIDKLQSCGSDFWLNGTKHYFSNPLKVLIGNNVHIGDNFYAKTDGGLIIESHVHISRNVTIYTENHDFKGDVIPYSNQSIHKPVFIGEGSWIGMNVSIAPGVKIGKGVILGIGSIIIKDVKDYEIIKNFSSTVVSTRDSEKFENSLEKNFIGGVNGKQLSEKQINKFKSSYFDNRKSPIVFVLGTGRSGSKSIVDSLNLVEGVNAYHEKFIGLIKLSTDYAYGKRRDIVKSEILEILKNTVYPKNSKLVIHSDQRFWNLSPILSEIFPNSKFVHLHRGVLKSVKSMYSRRWYEINEYPNIYNHEWAKYRLQGYNVIINPVKDWDKLSQIAKCTWYWNYVNYYIHKDLTDLNLNSFTVQLKNIGKEYNRLIKFIGLDINNSSTSFLHSNRLRKSDIDRFDYIDDNTMLNEINTFLKKNKETFNA